LQRRMNSDKDNNRSYSDEINRDSKKDEVRSISNGQK